MKLNLPQDVRKAAAQAPVEIHDETTDEHYYVISAEQYEKVRMLVDVEQVDPSFYEAGEIHLYKDE